MQRAALGWGRRGESCAFEHLTERERERERDKNTHVCKCVSMWKCEGLILGSLKIRSDAVWSHHNENLGLPLVTESDSKLVYYVSSPLPLSFLLSLSLAVSPWESIFLFSLSLRDSVAFSLSLWDSLVSHSLSLALSLSFSLPFSFSHNLSLSFSGTVDSLASLSQVESSNIIMESCWR